MYKIRDNVSLSKNYYILTLIFLFFGILAMVLMKYGFKIHGYYLVDTVTPLLLIVLTLILLCYRRLSFSDHIDYGLSFFGKYSLEIYISNYLSMNIIGLFKEADMYEKAYIYIALNIIGFICMIFANKAISKVIKQNIPVGRYDIIHAIRHRIVDDGGAVMFQEMGFGVRLCGFGAELLEQDVCLECLQPELP